MSDTPQEAVESFQEDEVGYKRDHDPEAKGQEKGHNQQDLEDDPNALDDTAEDNRPSGKVEPE